MALLTLFMGVGLEWPQVPGINPIYAGLERSCPRDSKNVSYICWCMTCIDLFRLDWKLGVGWWWWWGGGFICYWWWTFWWRNIVYAAYSRWLNKRELSDVNFSLISFFYLEQINFSPMINSWIAKKCGSTLSKRSIFQPMSLSHWQWEKSWSKMA